MDGELPILIGMLALGAYAMRAGGYLAARRFRPGPGGVEMVRLATGNLLVAVAVVGVAQLGWPALVGSVTTVGAMAMTGREWAALPVGAAAAAAAAALIG